jgi:hypothetical protein
MVLTTRPTAAEMLGGRDAADSVVSSAAPEAVEAAKGSLAKAGAKAARASSRVGSGGSSSGGGGAVVTLSGVAKRIADLPKPMVRERQQKTLARATVQPRSCSVRTLTSS